MKKLLFWIVLQNFMAIHCKGQSMLSSTDVKPIAPKGYILFTEAGAIEALKSKAELKIAVKQIAIKDSIIFQLKLKAEAKKQIAEAQKATIKHQKKALFWQNVKIYSGWSAALAILIIRL
jgi:hypothetical protein